MPHRRDARACRSLPQFVFVGERPSMRVRQMRVTWQDGRLAAKPLHTALRACGISPEAQRYLNLFRTHGPPNGQTDDPAAPATCGTCGPHHRRPRAPGRAGAGRRRDTASPARPPRRTRPYAQDDSLLRARPRHVVCRAGDSSTV